MSFPSVVFDLLSTFEIDFTLVSAKTVCVLSGLVSLQQVNDNINIMSGRCFIKVTHNTNIIAILQHFKNHISLKIITVDTPM